jgi:hypothetical protein
VSGFSGTCASGKGMLSAMYYRLVLTSFLFTGFVKGEEPQSSALYSRLLLP